MARSKQQALSVQDSQQLHQAIQEFRSRMSRGELTTLAPILPLIFRLRSQPYSLDWSHFMFEPFFRVVEAPRRLMLLCGRQVSKCLVVNGLQKVYLSNGLPVAGESLKVGDRLLTFDEQAGRPAEGRVLRTYRSDQKPCVRITTRMGTVIEAALTHPLLTPAGYVNAADLQVGASLAAVRHGAGFTDRSQEEARVALTAFMIGDGCCQSSTFSFTSCDNTTLQLFRQYLEQAEGGKGRLVRDAKSLVCAVRLSKKGRLRQWLEADGLTGKYSYEKHIPGWVFDLPKAQTKLFLECLWSTDGQVLSRSNGYNIGYCSTSRELVYQLKSLLLKFGIISSIHRRQAGYKRGGQYRRCRDTYILRCEGREAQERFLDTFSVPDKQLEKRAELPPENSNRDTLPLEANKDVWDLCDQVVYNRSNNSLRQAGLRHKPKYRLSRRKARQYIDYLQDKGVDPSRLEHWCDQEVVWDKIVSIEPLGEQDCWDVEVQTYHNYVVDGIVSHNSTSMAAAQIMRARVRPNYNILTVMPLYEQVRKFSQNYARPFIVTSPIKSRLIGELGTDSVLQRAIGDGSNLFYSYSSGDPSRVRGVPADECDLDEIQDLDHADLPVIEQCMGASPFKLVRLTGTPKTFDNTAHILWEDSSQAHWHIPCVCGHVNRCDTQGDLLEMIGEGRRQDGTIRTLICTKCGRQADSRAGYFVHDFPERQASFAGYHVPQAILPMHYDSPKDWQVLLETRRDKPQYIYYNEVLGESFDAGAKLVTQKQLEAAAVVKPCAPNAVPPGQYVQTAMGIDWGGRGKEKASDTEDFISNTAMALAGLTPDGKVDILWLYKVPYEVDQSQEARLSVEVASEARCDWLAMDYGGQGNVQEGQVRANGWPQERLVPFTYNILGPTRPIVMFNAPKVAGARSSYTLDKARSLLLLCELLKRGIVRLPKSSEYMQDHLRDFLNIYEEAIDNPSGSVRRLVKRMSRRTDDIVHAINFACMALFHSTQSWPAITRAFLNDEVKPME